MEFKLRNLFKKKQRILLYTDSRGKNLPYKKLASHASYNSYEHYSTKLSKICNADSYLMPEKMTTCADFIGFVNRINIKKYDVIILHAGVVDASPRHQKKMIDEIYPQKKEILNDIFGERHMKYHLNNDLKCDYEGDRTINFYSLEMARQKLLPRLKAIRNLIWISTNPILTEWHGTYWKNRPSNIKIIDDYSFLFLNELSNTISLMDWSEKDVMNNTFDGIHLNSTGSDILFGKLLNKLERF